MVRAVSAGKLSSFRESFSGQSSLCRQALLFQCTVIWCLDLLLAEDEGPKQDLSQKLCCFGQECGQLSDPCALTRKVAGCLEPKMAPPQKLSGSHLSQKLLAFVFHTLTRAACPLRGSGAQEALAGA